MMSEASTRRAKTPRIKTEDEKAKDRAYAKARYASDPEAGKAASRAYREGNPEKVRATKAKWEAKNREKHLAARRAYWAKNADKMHAKARASRKTNPRRAREYDVREHYGLAPEQLRSLESAHGDRCAICRNEGNGRALCVDHDHSTGEVRGLLCAGCNAAIGMMKDSPLRLRAAAAYLDRRQPKLLVTQPVPARLPKTG